MTHNEQNKRLFGLFGFFSPQTADGKMKTIKITIREKQERKERFCVVEKVKKAREKKKREPFKHYQ